jgi:two-component system chemotaxis sensor kinase CheA
MTDTSEGQGKIHEAISLASSGAIHQAIKLLDEATETAPRTGLTRHLMRLLEAIRHSEDEKELVLGEVQMFQAEVEETNSQLASEIAERKQAQAALRDRNEHLRAVLDNVGEGLLTLDRDGQVAGDASATISSWFGPLTEGDSFTEYLSGFAPSVATWFELGWDQVAAGMLPLDVALQQLPHTVAHGERTFHFSYIPIASPHMELETSRVLVVISDETAALEQKRLEARQRETLKLVNTIADDRYGFFEFFDATNATIGQLERWRELEEVELQRLVHTLKGNALLFGIETIAEICHEIENNLVESEEEPLAELFERLAVRWKELGEAVEPLHNGRSRRAVEVSRSELVDTIADLVEGAESSDIAQKVARWRLEPTRPRLLRFGEQARHIARRLGKGHVALTIEDSGLHVCPDRWGPFWGAFGHAVRNAVVHGLEGPEERARSGKPTSGRIELRTYARNAQFVVEIRDDGQGITWSSVSERAERLGLPCDTEEELRDALFCQGLTTAKQVDLGAGRGVGMSVIREVCEELGGSIELESTPGKGTTFRFLFADSMMAPTLDEVVSSRGPTRG